MPRVYAIFQIRQGWRVSFLEKGWKTPLVKPLTLASERKLLELAERRNAELNLEAREAIQHGVNIGRGGFYLRLSDEQYNRLK
jgi:hypothetical protein